jgi:hypothetical protein
MIDENRLIPPDDEPETSFTLVTQGEPWLVTDPTFIADYFNEDDPHSQFIRRTGVVLANFGGDVPCRIWWRRPYLVAAMSAHLGGDPQVPEGLEFASDDVAIDSGSLMFLPLTAAIPSDLQPLITECLEKFGGCRIELPAGRWTFFYEQHDPEEQGEELSNRNIVVFYKPL